MNVKVIMVDASRTAKILWAATFAHAAMDTFKT